MISKTGSLSRLGVTMYVCVSCWMRFTVAPFGPTTNPTTRNGTRTSCVTCPVGAPAGPPPPPTEGAPPTEDTLFVGLLVRLRRLARIWLKCSAAERISRLAEATSSRRPVTTKTGSSPLTGVLMYVFVLARRAFILHPISREDTTRYSYTAKQTYRHSYTVIQRNRHLYTVKHI